MNAANTDVVNNQLYHLPTSRVYMHIQYVHEEIWKSYSVQYSLHVYYKYKLKFYTIKRIHFTKIFLIIQNKAY